MRVGRSQKKFRKKGEMPKVDFDMGAIREIKKRKKGLCKRGGKERGDMN